MSDRSRGQARRDVHGVLLLDKPVGLSSNQAVQAVKRLYHARRVGHTGTLDPLATGLLVVVLGEATKFASGLLDADKSYEATIRLGVTTSTGDAEGEVLSSCEPAVARADVEGVVAQFVGEIDQVPPMHSALKKAGRPLYDYARAGETVARPPRRVVIHAIEIVGFDGQALRLNVRVGKGTYIRTLAEDIGRRLGCGAHLAALRRTNVGGFGLQEAVALADLEAAPPPDRDRLLRSVDAMLAELPEVVLDAERADRFLHGRPVAAPGRDGGATRVYGPGGAFLGRGQHAGGQLLPERVIATGVDRAACGTR